MNDEYQHCMLGWQMSLSRYRIPERNTHASRECVGYGSYQDSRVDRPSIIFQRICPLLVDKMPARLLLAVNADHRCLASGIKTAGAHVVLHNPVLSSQSISAPSSLARATMTG
jgi:hypothetical protein